MADDWPCGIPYKIIGQPLTFLLFPPESLYGIFG